MAQKTPKTEAASPGTRRDTLPRAPSRLRPAARSDKRLSSPAAWTLSLTIPLLRYYSVTYLQVKVAT